MAAVDLPAESYFFDYEAFSPGSRDVTTNQTVNSPSAGSGENSGVEVAPAGANTGDQRIPDTRNTLLWIDRLEIPQAGVKSLKFRAASAEGDYLILLRGVDPEGNPVEIRTGFRVER